MPLGVGRDPYPYSFRTLASFSARYTRHHECQRRVAWEGRYVVVSE